MEPMEKVMLQLDQLLPQIPYWARAEQMELSSPQCLLWRHAGQNIR